MLIVTITFLVFVQCISIPFSLVKPLPIILERDKEPEAEHRKEQLQTNVIFSLNTQAVEFVILRSKTATTVKNVSRLG